MDTSNAALELEALDHLRYGDSSIETFWGVDGRHTTHYTKASVFEARDGQGVYVPDLNDDEFRTHLQNDTPGVRQGRRLRIIFLDGDECNADLLPITSSTMQLTHDTYGIANRFSFYLSRQQMAGSSMHYDPVTNEPARMEFWYSVVVRTKAKAGPTESDNSRRVVNWSRCCVWADYDARTGDSTCFAWRYPLHMKQTFLDNFLGPRGGALQTHPMLLHASWMERLCTHTRDINLWFFEPLYEVEHQVGRLRSPADLFDSARSLTSVYRQIRQVLTDYEVFLVSAKSLRKQNEAMANLLKMYAERNGNHKPSTELQGQLHMTFKQVRRELKLGKTYLTLYLERCISGIADMQSVSTQHSAEVQIKTSKEFTQISRDSTEENQSLRTIQVMTAIFLPPSLISSLFGMGFFSTSMDGDRVVFSVARSWWWYPAITLPITILVLIVVCREWITWHPHKRRFVWKRRPSTEPDLETAFGKID